MTQQTQVGGLEAITEEHTLQEIVAPAVSSVKKRKEYKKLLKDLDKRIKRHYKLEKKSLSGTVDSTIVTVVRDFCDSHQEWNNHDIYQQYASDRYAVHDQHKKRLADNSVWGQESSYHLGGWPGGIGAIIGGLVCIGYALAGTITIGASAAAGVGLYSTSQYLLSRPYRSATKVLRERAINALMGQTGGK